MNTMLSEVTSEFEHATPEVALLRASEDAASTGGRIFPCIVFRQGKRLMISTSFPYTFVARHVQSDAAAKGESPRTKTNRPLMPDHVRTIQNYMRDNPDHYVMPPLTLNVRKLPQVHVHKSNAAVRAGHLVVDDSTLFYVTDGQHRIAAIAGHAEGRRPTAGIIDEIEDFREHGVAVQIVYEPDLANVHQDFADAAQTKPIPASLLASYNMREPLNRALTQIVDRSFLRDRVEETSKTLPKMSQYMFLLNQVRQFVKELLFRDYAMAETSVDRLAKQYLATEALQSEFIESAVTLLEVLSDEMTPWKEIKRQPVRGDATNRIPDYRQKYVNMTATGLVVIGRVCHQINKFTLDPANRRSLYVRLANEIDWTRNAEIWKEAIVNQEGKVQTQRNPVKIAADRVMVELGMIIEVDTEVGDEIEHQVAAVA